MSEKLIFADAFREEMNEYILPLTKNNRMGAADAYYRTIHLLDDAPAVDAVEVVRCKDCEFCRGSFDPWTKTSVQVCGYVGYNPVQSSQVEDNDYCSHGERRVDNETN